MENKNILFLGIIIFIAFAFFVQVGVAEQIVIDEFTDIGFEIFGTTHEDVSGQGLAYEDLGNGSSRFTFLEDDSFLSYNGKRYANIIPQEDAGHPTYIDFDVAGNIVKADVSTNEISQRFHVAGDKDITIYPNSRNIIDTENRYQKIILPDGANVEAFQEYYIGSGVNMEVDGNEITLPDGSSLNGKINYKDEQVSALLDEPVEINNVGISGENNLERGDSIDVNLGVQEENVNGNSVSFDLENQEMTLSSEDVNSISNFNQGNPFVNLGENNLFSVRNNPDSSARIQNRESQGMSPEVILRGNAAVTNGPLELEVSNDEVYLNDMGNNLNTVPAEIKTTDANGNSLIGDSGVVVDDKNNAAVSEENSGEVSERVRYVAYERTEESGLVNVLRKVTGRLRALGRHEQNIPTAVIGVKG
ncbi:MAG: hypothetical protein ABIH49_03635 [archaeon]